MYFNPRKAGKGAIMKTRMINLYVGLVISVIIYLAIAVILIATQKPVQAASSQSQQENISFDSLLAIDYTGMTDLRTYEARDGTGLYYREYLSSTASDRVLVLLHGSAWHSMQFFPIANYLSQEGLAHVVTPDLRGHGFNPKRRGDVDYIGQLEDDLADLIAVIKQQHPSSQIILGGHSSGGGLAVRFAGSKYNDLIDAYVLLAPFLKYNAPTTRPNSGDWAAPLTRRIIGLSMLNNVGIKVLNHLNVINFNMPSAVLEGPLGNTATTSYSYRLNTAYAPRSNYTSDLKAMIQPFLLVAGTADESFIAEEYEPIISKHTQSGTYILLDDVSHIGVLAEPEIQTILKKWLLDF